MEETEDAEALPLLYYDPSRGSDPFWPVDANTREELRAAAAELPRGVACAAGRTPKTFAGVQQRRVTHNGAVRARSGGKCEAGVPPYTLRSPHSRCAPGPRPSGLSDSVRVYTQLPTSTRPCGRRGRTR